MIEQSVFEYTEDYIYSIQSLIKCEICFYKSFHHIDLNTKYIFWVRLPSNLKITNETNNIYLFNTEQMSRKYDNLCENMNKIPKQIKIIDYSKENLKYFDNYRTFFLPYQVNYNEIFNFKKSKDVCIISDSNMSKRRKYIVDKSREKNINVDVIQGFGKKEICNFSIIK